MSHTRRVPGGIRSCGNSVESLATFSFHQVVLVAEDHIAPKDSMSAVRPVYGSPCSLRNATFRDTDPRRQKPVPGRDIFTLRGQFFGNFGSMSEMANFVNLATACDQPSLRVSYFGDMWAIEGASPKTKHTPVSACTRSPSGPPMYTRSSELP